VPLISVIATGTNTTITTAAVASYLAALLSICPPAMLAAITSLIVAMGVVGFCTWSQAYLKERIDSFNPKDIP
jgi:hypothetical protein